MPGFVETPGLKAYNLYSEKVLEDARKALGLKASQKAYKAMLMEIFDCSPRLYEEYRLEPSEIVAYALDREERNKTNALSKAIAERF